MSPCTAYTLAGDSISRDCISPASHQATPQVLCSPVGPLPCLPISLTGGELRAPVRPAPLRPSRPRSASRAPAAARTPHHTPRRCCCPAAPPSRGCCTTPRCAATPSPLRHRRLVVVLPLRRRRLAVELPLCRRRLAVELPLRRRRLAVELRCVAVASPSRCCGAVTLPPSCRGCAAAFPACASPVTLPTTLRRRAERSLD